MRTYKIHKTLFIFVLLYLLGEVLYSQALSKKYIFIGHCYQPFTEGNKVDLRLEVFDFSSFNGIWLGGDVCSETTLNFSTMQYIDSLFNIRSPETHWSMGNHDARNGNWEWYEQLTGRMTYYAYYNNGITRIVMNTNLVPTNCNDLDQQFKMISDVCDTIQNSSDLVLLMHHGLWRDIPDLPPPATYAQSDLVYWNANCDSVNTQFVDVIYPKLVEAKNRGINVTCIMGDLGSQLKVFDMYSVDSIRFFGCGFHNNDPDDQVIFIEKDEPDSPLKFSFHRIDSLLNQ